MWPPTEFYPNHDILWWIHKAMYGLRTSPQDWQQHFAQVLSDMGFQQMQSDANLYVKLGVLIFMSTLTTF